MNINKMALSATLHCLSGCAIGEIVGLIFGAYLGLASGTIIILATGLAFVSGYVFSTLPIIRTGQRFLPALKLVLAADTISIATMEVTDNVTMLVIPGAMSAGLSDIYFWISMSLSLVAAFVAAYPVNRYLLQRGKGHALTHQYHHAQARYRNNMYDHYQPLEVCVRTMHTISGHIW